MFGLFRRERSLGPREYRTYMMDYGGEYSLIKRYPMMWGDLDHTDTPFLSKLEPVFYPPVMREGDL